MKAWKVLMVLSTVAVIQTTGAVSAQESKESESLNRFELEGITVTAMGYKQKELDTPADTQVYSEAELRKTGAENVAGALMYKTGIQYSGMGPHGQNWITGNAKINLRGIDGGTLVLINGIPASFNQVSHLDAISLDQVERVEVVKGGGAILYGSEALGGVINIITKENYKNHINVALGNQGQHNYALSLQTGKLGVVIGRDEFGATGDMSVSAVGNRKINNVSVPYKIAFGDSIKDNIGLTYKFNDNLRFVYMYNQKDYSILYNDATGARGEIQHFDYNDRESFYQLMYENKGFSGQLFYNYRKIDNTDYYLDTASKIERERSQHKVYGLDVRNVWEMDTNKYILGTTIKKETYGNKNQKFSSFSDSQSPLKPEAYFGTYNMLNYSLFGQWNKRLSKATNIILGLREDVVNSDGNTYNAFLPQIQAITRLNDKSSVYVNIGKSFRMPTFRNLYYSSSILKANPDLDPETGWNYEFGYKQQNKTENWKAALFHTKIKGQLSTRKVVGDPAGRTEAYNAAQYENTGLELSYTKQLSDEFSFTVGGIYSNPKRQEKASDVWKNVLGRYQLMTALNYDNDKTAVSLNLSYWGARTYYDTQTDKSPLLVSNLYIRHKLAKNWALDLNVDNIFNRQDIINNDTNSKTNDYYTLGRTFRLGVSLDF